MYKFKYLFFLELKEEIEDRIGNQTYIFAEPDWFDDENTIHSYVPDEDGVVRPGAY